MRSLIKKFLFEVTLQRDDPICHLIGIEILLYQA